MSETKELALQQISADRVRLRAALALPGMSCRNIAAFTGTSKAAISRMQNYKPLSAENYLSIHIWLDSISGQQAQERNTR